MLIRDKPYLRVSQKTAHGEKRNGGLKWVGGNMGYKKSRWSRIVTLLISLEGVTKDIKDERQPMGKRDTVV